MIISNFLFQKLKLNYNKPNKDFSFYPFNDKLYVIKKKGNKYTKDNLLKNLKYINFEFVRY